METSEYLKKAKKINSLLGFKGTKSFSEMFKGGTLNTFGKSDCSVPILSLYSNDKDELTSMEVNTIYFKPTQEVIQLREHIQQLNTKDEFKFGITLDAAIEFLENLKK